MKEGESCEWWGHGAVAAGPIEIDGALWNHHVVRVLRPDPTAARTLARSLSAFGSSLGDQLDAEIDRAAFAVDSAWSLLATWGGTGGYKDLAGDLGGFGTSGCGCGSGGSSDTIGIGHFGTIAPRLDLRSQLQAAVEARCHLGTTHVRVALEMTLDEIVDVQVTMPPDQRALADCVVEAVWDTAVVLPAPPTHSHADLVLGD